MFKSLLRLFGISEGTAKTSSPDVPTPRNISRPASAVSAPVKVVGREEILDARCRIAGYRYRMLRPHISAADYLAALQLSERVKELSASRLAVIRLDAAAWRQAGFASLVGENTLFEIDLPKPHSADPDLAPLFEEVRATGAGLAVAHETFLALPEAAMQLPTLVIFDLAAHPLEEFEQHARDFALKRNRTWIAVRNVSSWNEQRFCLSLGARYLLGSFVDATDQSEETGSIGQSRSTILEMLNLLRREGSHQELAEAAKRDPATAVRLLTMANSPLSGFSRKLASIDQAIMVLGREKLYRWLTMALFRAGGDTPRMQALLEHALYRARFLELAGASAIVKQDCDELFLVGLLSYTDVLLDIPMREVLGRMQVVEEVGAALLRREGKLGPYLDLVMSLQRGESDHTALLAGSLGFEPDQVDGFHAAALDWATEMMQAQE